MFTNNLYDPDVCLFQHNNAFEYVSSCDAKDTSEAAEMEAFQEFSLSDVLGCQFNRVLLQKEINTHTYIFDGTLYISIEGRIK